MAGLNGLCPSPPYRCFAKTTAKIMPVAVIHQGVAGGRHQANNTAVTSAPLRFGDRVFGRIPVVKTIYVAIRDFMRFFPSSGQSGDLKRVVLVPMGPGKIIGFVTAESGATVGLAGEASDAVAVYLPMSYMVGGYTVFLPRDLLVPTSLTIEAGMRIALMGAVHAPAGVAATAR